MQPTSRVPITRVSGEAASRDEDVLAVEEPLEIRIGEKPVSVTLRTPGEDFELAAGFLFSESILHAADEIESIRHWGSPNVVRVQLRDGVKLDLQRLQRHFYSTSSCGVCGKTSIDALRVQTAPVQSDLRMHAAKIIAMPELLRAQQTSFDATGAIHGAAIFDADGNILRAREDVGRHNAVDKVIGSFFLESATPLAQHALVVSGRLSFEIVQKTIVAGIPILAAVGAPSTLAVELAHEFGVTLIGFVRGERFNVYTSAERIVSG
ncbi:MAG TPA: formate dehydrogenase accessory sulfurtransferase FdhD [Thermoanaerobaculia bacterium]|nr:formate dehydrogenase accessory sulfurtransferase FdhD [Thermoanaerobaculia bacterium]